MTHAGVDCAAVNPLTRVSGVSSAELTSFWMRNRIMMNRIGVTVMQQLLRRLRRWNAAFLRMSAPAWVLNEACRQPQ
jgi:hypothetical protein